MFFRGSRYLRVADATIDAADGRPMKFKVTRLPVVASGDFLYQVKEGDRLDLLAYRFYRTPRKWWLISDANTDLMVPDDLLTPGRQILIPKDRSA